MRILMCSLVCSLLVWGMGCSKGTEELTSFADQIVQLKGYNETLARYLALVKANPEEPGEANQIGKVLEEYNAAMSKIPRPGDITLKALHGKYVRGIERAQQRIEPPGDPMFALEAQRAIMGLQSDVESIYETLQELLQMENLADQYTLEWPSTGE